MAAKQCKHLFKGHKDGVTCMKCGLTMNPKEYQEYLKPKEDKKEDKKDETKQEDKGE